MPKNVWFVLRDGNSTGPFTDSDLRKMASEGSLAPDHPIRREGSEKVHKARSIRGLFPNPTTQPPETISIPVPSPELLPFPEKPALPETATAVVPAEPPIKWEVLYQGGLPDFPEPAPGNLILNGGVLTFTSTGPKTFYFPVSLESIVELGRPGPGSHLKSTIDKAKSAETLSSATRNIGKFAGGLVGGFGGRLLKSASAAASDMTKGGSKLGAPPRNRLQLLVDRGGRRQKITLEIHRDDLEKTERETADLWRQLDALLGETRVGGVPAKPVANPAAAPAGAEQIPGLGFTLFRNGQLVGPLPPFLVREMLARGELRPDDHVRVEYWIPASAIGLLDGTGGQIPSATGQGGPAAVPGIAAGPAGVQGAVPGQTSRSALPGLAYLAGGAAVGAIAAGLLSGNGARAAGSRGTAKGRRVLIDSDGDGTADGIAMDTDGDGRMDAIGLDRDHDGRIDAIGIDRDGDGDIDAVGIDNDGDGDIDAVGLDNDGDGDIDAYGTDSDGDGDFSFFSSDDD